MNKKIAVISLGCDKNRVDTEKMLFLLEQAGYEFTQDCYEADILMVNTCGFIEDAKKESIDAILQMAQIKNDSLDKKLIVTGCLAQRYGEELFADIPEADAIIGVEAEQNIVDIIMGLNSDNRILNIDRKKNEFSSGRVMTTPYHYAYLKIADGCNNHCSYCAIPKIKGKYRSEKIEDIMCEAKQLIEQGAKELILVAQDTTLYGIDIYGKPMLKELLQKLTQIENLWKVRLLYAYPERVNRELVELISRNDKIAKYIDIPLQHVDDFILKRMNRQTSSSSIIELLKMIKQVDSEIAIRSTFIVGFNGESMLRFKRLKKFLLDIDEIDYAGFFSYSVEEGTLASKFKEKNVNKLIINKRKKQLEKLWSKKIVQNHKRYIGRDVEIIYEGIDFDKQMFWGRIEQNTPEVDTRVYFSSDMPLEIGNVYRAEIVDAGFDLYAKVRSL